MHNNITPTITAIVIAMPSNPSNMLARNCNRAPSAGITTKNSSNTPIIAPIKIPKIIVAPTDVALINILCLHFPSNSLIHSTGFSLSSTLAGLRRSLSLPQRTHWVGVKTTQPCLATLLFQPQARQIIFSVFTP